MLDKNSRAEIALLKEEREWLRDKYELSAMLLAPHLADMDNTKQKKYSEVAEHYAGEAPANLVTMSRGLFTHMMGSDVDWFEALIPGDAEIMRDPASQEFFDLLRQSLTDEMGSVGLYEHVEPTIQQAAAFGTTFTSVTGDYWDNRIDVQTYHVGDVFIGQDFGGRTDRVAIRVKTAPIYLKEIEGIELSKKDVDSLNRAARGDQASVRLAKTEKTVWMYMRRMAPGENGFNPTMKWRFQLLGDDGHIYSESFLYNLPGAIWRMEKWARTAYGYCPGFRIQRQLLQSNKLQKYMLMETDYRLRPPVWMPQTSSNDYLEPGSIVISDSNNPGEYPRRIIDPADMNPAILIKENLDALSRIHLYTDFFLQLTGSTNRKTTDEVRGMMIESSAQITPLVHSFEAWMMGTVRRFMTVMAEQDRLPEPSTMIKRKFRSGESGNLGVKFIGPLSKARRYLYSVGQDMQMVNNVVVPLAKMGPEAAQEVLDRYDIGKQIDRAEQFMSGGKSIIRSQEEADQRKQQRIMQQMMQMAQQMQQEALKQGKAPEAGSPAQQVMQEAGVG